MCFRKVLLILSVFMGSLWGNTWGSHLFGGEIFYTHVAGLTYRVTLVLYGDCGGSPAAFQGLTTATPTVVVFNNTSQYLSVNLTPQSGSGVNVSPVCPDEIMNTTCNQGTLPGVKRFTYTANVTLGGTSSNWVFRFNGSFNNNTSAGRSNSITNIIVPGGGSLFCLEATLNNTNAITNSSPTYTSIPTPFFCNNFPQEYNQGAVDPNGDSLVFSLVPGLAALGNVATDVTYIPPYNAQNPIGAAPATFNFNNTTGQLSFTPNIPQQALVVGKVNEYRNGVLIGTSMREMIIVVLNNCFNSPPNGTMTNPVNGTIVGGTTFKVCKFAGTVSFNITVSDPNGDNVTLSTEGLPAGATTNIVGNNTNAPVVSLSWNITNVNPGTYTFYLNYNDDGCPLATKKTVAYSIVVMPKPTMTFTLLTQSTCISKAVFAIGTSGTDAPYTLNVTQGATPVLTVSNITTSATDSVLAGTYNFRLTNASGCYVDTSITFSHIVDIARQISWTAPKCANGSNGSIQITASGSNPPFQYALNSSAYGNASTFGNLSAGTYIVRVKDNIGCVKDSTITITNPPGMVMGITKLKPVCRPVDNGQITITASNGNSPYQFAINGGTFGTSSTFTGLGPGTYTLHIKDAENCLKDSSTVLIDSMSISLQALVTKPLCYGNANGSITVIPSGATAPYSFALGSSTVYNSVNTFSNLISGTYTVKVKDQNQCTKDTTITITQPAKLSFALAVVNVMCYGESTGSVNITGTGGTPAYQYGLNAGGFQSVNPINNITAGTHTVKIKDANGCTHDSSITITQPVNALKFSSVELTNPTCEGFTDGSVNVTGQGGATPYTYKRNGQTFSGNNLFANLAAGNYTFTLRDFNGCEVDTYIVLTGYPKIEIDSFAYTEPSCFGYSDGVIRVYANGGISPLQYSANQSGNWQSSSTLNNIKGGENTINIKDKEGCLKDTLFVLTQPEELIANVTSGSDCNGYTDGGYIVVNPSGGVAPFKYQWAHEPGLDTSKVIQLKNGRYFVTVTDVEGCQDTASVNLLLTPCCKPYIPNAFSPNNDGNNDVYKVLYLADMKLTEIQIYNRYGQRVFYSFSQDQGWDGTFNGKPVDAGTYYYTLTITCGNITQKELVFKGDITVLR